MNDTAATATDQNPNELSTEMTDEQMTEFVDNQIGPQPMVNAKIGYGDPQAPPATKPDEENKTDEESKDAAAKAVEEQKQAEADKAAKVAQEAKDAEEAAKAEADKSADIPAVDTSDLWVEVDAYVLEGEGDKAKPVEKTVRISLDAGEIPDNVRFRNDKQLMEVLDSLQEMRTIRTERTAKYEQAVAEKAQTESQAKERAETLAGWDREIEDMTAAGILTAAKAPPADASGYTEEEIKADPSLELIDNVFKFMASENDKRLAEKKAPLGSFGTAYNLYMKQSTSKEEEDKAKAEAELTKKRGALVGGGSNAAGPAKTDKVYKSGSARSIWGVDTSDLQ